MKRIAPVLLFTSLILGTLVGCQNPSGNDDEDKDLPTATKTWEVNGSDYQFYTNDPAYYDYAFWYTLSNSDTSAIFTGFTGVVKKVSGASGQGYGFRFCNADSANYYRILISTLGSYQIGKEVSGTWTLIKDWTSSSSLKTGLNKENQIQITRTTSGNFTIYFNGNNAYSFWDISLTSDKFAAFTTVGDAENEKFPNTPEDIRIRFVAPEVFPTASAKALVSRYSSGEWEGSEEATFSAHR